MLSLHGLGVISIDIYFLQIIIVMHADISLKYKRRDEGHIVLMYKIVTFYCVNMQSPRGSKNNNAHFLFRA